MAVKKHTTGWCNTAQLVEGQRVHSSVPAEEWHGKCRGGAARPAHLVTRIVGGKEVDGKIVGGKEQTALEEQDPWLCSCPCHAGAEVVITAHEPIAQTRVKAASSDGAAPVGRNKRLREAMAEELKARRFIELEKTGNESEDHKLVSRIHSAAKSVGLKVRTSCKGEKITGRVV